MTPKPLARILVVDDEAAQMQALRDTLRDHGFETAGFSDGPAALAALRASRFDVLLTDLMMPEMDGIALLREALGTDPNLVGIIMTGEGTIATAVAAMKTGAFDYVLKPFKLSVILPVLSRALAMRQLRLEKLELEQHLRERTTQLEAANQELEAFSYSVSHDLRAPLRHVQGYVEMLTAATTGQLSDQARRYLKTISEASVEMGQLIDDLLAFSRMGRTEVHETSVRLDALVSDTVRRLEMATQGRNIVWKIAPLPPVLGDPSLLKQVLANLVGNAIKYSRPRDPAVIEIGVMEEWRNGGMESAQDSAAPSQPSNPPTLHRPIVFFVRDNGAGFDMQYAHKLFGVFQRLHRADEFEGTGIGLATVRRIIARHGGRTWAEGKVGEGATFYFTLKTAVIP